MDRIGRCAQRGSELADHVDDENFGGERVALPGWTRPYRRGAEQATTRLPTFFR